MVFGPDPGFWLGPFGVLYLAECLYLILVAVVLAITLAVGIVVLIVRRFTS